VPLHGCYVIDGAELSHRIIWMAWQQTGNINK
jgi:hypothetical protein